MPQMGAGVGWFGNVNHGGIVESKPVAVEGCGLSPRSQRSHVVESEPKSGEEGLASTIEQTG